ncbi:Phospholipase A-2-activating protein [Mycena kentingensis (nom. inval.)]|nr:Phospholipase A-2-activating protein [Mycena kentingensis (nom. inval.)]
MHGAQSVPVHRPAHPVRRPAHPIGQYPSSPPPSPLTLSATRPNMRRELLPPEPRLGAPWSGAPSKPSRRASHAQPGCGLVHPPAASTPTPASLSTRSTTSRTLGNQPEALVNQTPGQAPTFAPSECRPPIRCQRHIRRSLIPLPSQHLLAPAFSCPHRPSRREQARTRPRLQLGLPASPAPNALVANAATSEKIPRTWHSVWDALAMAEDEFITGFRGQDDKSLEAEQGRALFQSSQRRRPFAGTSPTSGSHLTRSGIKVWSLGGDLIYSFLGLTSFIYQLAGLPSGDLVSSSEDRSVRVWKGSRVGQTSLVSKGDATQVYQWDGSEGQLLGERAEAPANTGAKSKVHYEGKEYDYVWSVAIEDGEPALRLPYNVSAVDFLERNGLPLNHVNTVVELIYQNTAGETLGGGGGEDFGDPFTGASRYRSSAPPTTGKHKRVGVLRSIHWRVAVPKLRHLQHGLFRPFHRRVAVLRRSSIRHVSGAGSKSGWCTSRCPVGTAEDRQPPCHEIEAAAVQRRAANGNFDNVASLYIPKKSATDEAFAHVQQSAAGNRPTNPLAPDIDLLIQVLERWPASLRLPVLDLAFDCGVLPRREEAEGDDVVERILSSALHAFRPGPAAHLRRADRERPRHGGRGVTLESVYRALVGLGNVVLRPCTICILASPLADRLSPFVDRPIPSADIHPLFCGRMGHYSTSPVYLTYPSPSLVSCSSSLTPSDIASQTTNAAFVVQLSRRSSNTVRSSMKVDQAAMLSDQIWNKSVLPSTEAHIPRASDILRISINVALPNNDGRSVTFHVAVREIFHPAWSYDLRNKAFGRAFFDLWRSEFATLHALFTAASEHALASLHRLSSVFAAAAAAPSQSQPVALIIPAPAAHTLVRWPPQG